MLCWNEDSLNQCWTSWWHETWCVHLLNTPRCLWTMMLQPLYYVSCVAPSNWPNEKQRNRAFLFISILSPPTISHSQWKPMHISDLQQQDEHIKDNSVPLVTYWDPWRNWANVNKMLFSCYEKEECLLWSYKTIIKECHDHFDMTLLANNTWPIAGSHPAQGGCNAHALWAPKEPEGLFLIIYCLTTFVCSVFQIGLLITVLMQF